MNRFHPLRSTFAAILLAPVLVISTPGCSGGTEGGPMMVVSPQPLPVDQQLASITTRDVHVSRTAGTTQVSGRAGAVSPAGATVRVFALDVPRVSAQVTAAADGSFSARLSTAAASELFFEAEAKDVTGFGSILDVGDAGALEDGPSPACLTNDVFGLVSEQSPPGHASSFTFHVTETCGSARAIRVVMQDGRQFVVNDAPTTIAAHQTLTLTVVHIAQPTAGDDADLVIITDTASRASPMVVALDVTVS